MSVSRPLRSASAPEGRLLFAPDLARHSEVSS